MHGIQCRVLSKMMHAPCHTSPQPRIAPSAMHPHPLPPPPLTQWTEGMTHACEDITQLCLRAVKMV